MNAGQMAFYLLRTYGPRAWMHAYARLSPCAKDRGARYWLAVYTAIAAQYDARGITPADPEDDAQIAALKGG